MALQRLFPGVVPLFVFGSVMLTIVAGPQWAPPIGAGVLAAGDSMEPTICAGDLVVYSDGTDIDEGDVITFYTRTEPVPIVTHRVVGVTDRGYVTQGDNRRVPDYPVIGYVRDEDVIGEVIMVASIQPCVERSDSGQTATIHRTHRLASDIAAG